MTAVFVYALGLLVAGLLSQLAQRTVLSTALLFLAAGFVAGDGVLGLIVLAPGDAVVTHLVEVALFTVLFTDGMHAGLRDLRSAWRLPGRALLLGLPLTLLVIAASIVAHSSTDVLVARWFRRSEPAAPGQRRPGDAEAVSR